MKFHINWKAGILSAVVMVVFGIAFFGLVGSKVDAACLPAGDGAGCRVWQTVHTVTTGYGEFWLQWFAPRCVGDYTPDDCIGPAIGVMFWTLLVIGFVLGNLIWRKKSEETSSK